VIKPPTINLKTSRSSVLLYPFAVEVGEMSGSYAEDGLVWTSLFSICWYTFLFFISPSKWFLKVIHTGMSGSSCSGCPCNSLNIFTHWSIAKSPAAPQHCTARSVTLDQRESLCYWPLTIQFRKK